MKRFTFRLFLVRKLIESLTWSCIDEYTEFEDVADGLGRTLSALDGMRKPRRALNADPEAVETPDPELAKRMKLLSKYGDCVSADRAMGLGKNEFCRGCFTAVSKCKYTRPDYWDCTEEQKSARRWLAEHGIKE